MKYAVNAEEMKAIDSYTIEQIGIPSLVLMERAALSVVQTIGNIIEKDDYIVAVCGTGNNGGDGIAIARILHMLGYQVDIILLGDSKGRTEETTKQLSIAANLGISIRTNFDLNEYTIIIDAIFGIGLQRDIKGDYEEAIRKINQSKAKIYSVDIPSGVNASTGKIMNVAVKADITITFGENKLGLLLFPGASNAGKVIVADIGFPDSAVKKAVPRYHYYEIEDLSKIPKRGAYSNKGSYGHVLIIAGSKRMTGAAYLSAIAAYRMGCGLVKVLTSDAGVEVIRTLLPEALYDSYEGPNSENVMKESIAWASTIVIGPGLSTDSKAKELLSYVRNESKVPTVFDADALKLLAYELTEKQIISREERVRALGKLLPRESIITPHLKELAELLSCKTQDIIGEFIDIPEQCTYNNELIYVIKDARTIVAQNKKRYLNISGNHGMATGGSGDVLTGIIAGLIATGLDSYTAATLGVYIHGVAGDTAARQKGYHSMLASDIVGALSEVIKEYEGRSIQ